MEVSYTAGDKLFPVHWKAPKECFWEVHQGLTQSPVDKIDNYHLFHKLVVVDSCRVSYYSSCFLVLFVWVWVSQMWPLCVAQANLELSV